jgi:hypothetical protein
MTPETVQLNAGQIRRAIRTFRDYSGDLLNADSSSFADRLRMLIRFCESDAVFSTLHTQLINHPTADLNRWLSERGNPRDARLSGLVFPTDVEERISLQYQLLVAGANEPEYLIGRLHLWFYINHGRVSDYIGRFAQTILTPMFREIGYRLEDIEVQLPADRTTEVSLASLQIIHVETAHLNMNRTQTVNVQSSHGFQIGDHNSLDNSTVNLNITLQQILDGIDGGPGSADEKAEAKNRFSKFLEHPLVCSIIGGVAGVAASPSTYS